METNFTQVKITSQPDSTSIRIPIICTQNPNTKLYKTNHTKNFYPTSATFVDLKTPTHTFSREAETGAPKLISFGINKVKRSLLQFAMILAMLFGVSNTFGQAVSIWTNPITVTNPGQSNPWTTGDVKNTNIAVSGIGRGAGLGGRNNNDLYNTRDFATTTLNLSNNDYFTWTLTPAAGYHINFSSFVYTGTIEGGSASWSFRSNAASDAFATNIPTAATAGATISLTGSNYQNITAATEFRLYGYSFSTGNNDYGVSQFTYNGAVLGTSVTAITGFTACVNNAGTAQSFIINGEGLSSATATITVAGSTNYEVSVTSATTVFNPSVTFNASGGAVAAQTVWVRLKSNATAGNYNGENINISGGGFTVGNAINVACSGTVSAPPAAPTAASATPTTICTGSTTNLTATSAGNTINWYIVSSGGTSIGSSASGANFSVAPTTTTTYYAEALSPGGCVSASRTSVTVTVTTTAPTITCPGNQNVNATSGTCGAAVTYTLPTLSSTCATYPPAGFGTPVLNTANGRYYALSSAAATWANADAACRTTGGHLATVSNAAENTFLTNLAGVNTVWIGFTDQATEGTFRWVTGETVSYTNWNAGEPNNSSNEDYTELNTSGGWNDNSSTLTNRYIIEFEVTLTQTAGLASGANFPVGVTTNTYTATNASGVAATCSFTVTVNNSLPAPTSVTANPSTICAGSSSNLNATTSAGNTIRWWDALTGGTNIGNTASGVIFPVTPAATATYYAEAINTSGGCVSTSRTPVTVTVTASVTPSVSIAANPGNTICAGTSVTFTATPTNGGTPSYQWKLNGGNVGTNSATYTNTSLANGNQVSCVMTSTATCASPATATSGTITMVVTTPLIPSVSIAAVPSGAICAGTNVTFTATAGNTGGGTVNYNFKIGVNSVQSGASNTYSSSALANGNAVTCDISITGGTCISPNTASSNTINMTVNPVVTPSVVIAANPGNNICAGTSVTFTATPTNGGTPSYQWKLNGGNVGTNSATYTTTTLANSNQVSCVMTSNATCASPATATSNTITMSVTPTVNPACSIAVSPTGTICAGTSVTFTATPTNGGTPSYQWKLNGGNVGTNSATYTNTSLANGNQVSCVLTSTATCPSPPTATSNPINIVVTTPLTPAVSIGASPSGAICLGTNVTFTATATNFDGGTVTYNFKVAGTSVQNTTANTWSSSALANGNIVTCDISVSGGSCLTANTASATPITMTVNPLSMAGTASAIDSEVCSGGTAILSLAGSLGSIQWQQSPNGTDNWVSVSGGTGGNSSPYNTPALTAPTWYRAAVNGLCPAVFSNAVQVKVNPRPTSLISGTTTTCTGQSATLSIALTGTAPWSLTYTDGTTSTPVTGITTSPYTFSVPASTKTYTVTALTDANCTAQAGDLTGSAVLTVNPGCVMLTTLNPIPTATAPSNQTYYSGVLTAAIPLSGTPEGVVFDITGGAAVGLENQTGVTSVPSFTPSSGSATITVTPISAAGCTGAGKTYTITINSTPTVTAPANQSYCVGVATTALTLTGTPTGFVFDITGGSSVGLTDQTGLTAIPSFTPVAGTTTVTITPKANGFTGTPVSYGITVNSLPTVSAGSPFTKTCTLNATGAAIGETNASGYTYSWSPAAGLSSATASNPSANPSTTTTYTVTKTNTATGCSTQATVDVTVDNTSPTVAPITGTTSVCAGSTTILSSTTVGGVWSTANNAIATVSNGVVTGVSGGTTNISYTVTGSNGCATVVSSSVTVKALPSVNAITSQVVCSGSSTTAVTLASSPAGSTFAWTTSATTGITGQTAGGTGNIPVQILSTSAASAGTVTYTITPTLNGCQGPAGTFSVTVNPLPTLTINTNLYGCETADLANAITSFTGTITYPSGQNVTSNGGYTIRATMGTCWIERTVIVQINPLPTVTIGTINNICEGSTAFAIPFTVTGGANQYTLTGTGIDAKTLQALGDSPIAANLTSSGFGTRNFALTVRNSTTGCVSTEVMGSVTAIPAPDLSDPCFYSCSGIATGIMLPAKDDYDLPLTTYIIYDAGNSDEQNQPYKTISGTFTGEDAINAIKNDILINESTDQITVSYGVIPYAGDCAGVPFYIDVLVNPLPSAPTGAATQSFCSGNSPTVANLAATGSAIGNAIQWYAVSSGGTALVTSTPLVNGTHYYASQSTTCESTARLDVTAIINATPVLTGLTTSASSVCAGDPSVVTIGATSLPNGSYTVNYTLTGANAHAATDVTMTVTSVNSGTFNISSLSVPGTTTLTINSIMLNGCTTNATTGNSTTITVTATGTWLGTSSTSWNNASNWCGGVPISSTNVIIPSGTTYQPMADVTSAVCNNLTINTSAILTIGAGQALTVSGTLTKSAGTAGLILQSDATGTASLINGSTGVQATVNRYITGHDSAWHFLSTPVSAQAINGTWLPTGTLPVAYGNGTKYDLYVWNEPTSCWIYKLNTTAVVNWTTVHPGANFVVGRGYLYSVLETNPTKTFAGTLNTGDLNFAITSTTATPENSFKGFNLVGNPYPSSVDWKGAGWSRSSCLLNPGSGYDMWIYNPIVGNYGVYNSSDGTGIGTNSVTQYIAPMQGFFVRASSSGNLGFSNALRVHNGASDWKSATIDPNQFSVVVKSAADHMSDEARLLFGYHENQPGAAKLFSPVATAPSLYLPAGGLNYTVRYLTDTIDNPVVPVMFKPGVNGTYTLQCNFEPTKFETVLLEDLKTQNIQDLKISPAYQFSATVSDVANRFALHFAPITTTSLKELPGKITTDGLHIFIDLTFVSGPTEVMVYDVLGRKLYEQQVPGETITTLNFNAGRQLLLVKLQNPQGSLCRKIIGSNK
ncbi:MAG: lectin-like protein [Mariniphaga sp.]